MACDRCLVSRFTIHAALVRTGGIEVIEFEEEAIRPADTIKSGETEIFAHGIEIR